MNTVSLNNLGVAIKNRFLSFFDKRFPERVEWLSLNYSPDKDIKNTWMHKDWEHFLDSDYNFNPLLNSLQKVTKELSLNRFILTPLNFSDILKHGWKIRKMSFTNCILKLRNLDDSREKIDLETKLSFK